MSETGEGFVSVEGIINWVLLLLIFSVITAVGNYLGYRHPLHESLIGMGILSLIALLGVWMEKHLPFRIPSIVYIAVLGIALALPLMPTSGIVVHYVSEVEIISIVTVFLAYAGISIANRWDDIRSFEWRALGITLLIVMSLYVGSAVVMHMF